MRESYLSRVLTREAVLSRTLLAPLIDLRHDDWLPRVLVDEDAQVVLAHCGMTLRSTAGLLSGMWAGAKMMDSCCSHDANTKYSGRGRHSTRFTTGP